MDMYPVHKANDDAEKSPFVIVGLGVGSRQSSVKAVASDLDRPIGVTPLSKIRVCKLLFTGRDRLIGCSADTDAGTFARIEWKVFW